MAVISWTEIESFHNIRKYSSAHPEILNGNSVVEYKGKIKLHGTNGAIQVHIDGFIIPQSRTQELTIENDNYGFAKFVFLNSESWYEARGHIIYGEWAGSNIQKGVALSNLPKKVFAVFAARDLSNLETLIIEPEELKELVYGIPDVYVLPWHTSISIDWSLSSDKLTNDVEAINKQVLEVEANDPWVESTFGIKGTGEGIVFYPVSKEHLGVTNYNNLVFKSKGEAHKNIKTASPAQLDASSAANITEFVDMVLTTARLEQGVGAVSVAGTPAFDMKLIGKFLAWVWGDVQKETQDELEASGLEWKQVQKPINDKARAWYLAKSKEL